MSSRSALIMFMSTVCSAIVLLALPNLVHSAFKNADLAVSVTAGSDRAVKGGEVSYTYRVLNQGPDMAKKISVTGSFSSKIRFVSGTGGCQRASAKAVVCKTNTMGNGAETSWTVTISPQFSGNLVHKASVKNGVSDKNKTNNTASVTTTVREENQPPQAADDLATTPQNTPVAIQVLANDTDADGDTLTVVIGASPAHGTVVINANGTLRYTPEQNFTGSDTISYTVSDGLGGTDGATVAVTVTPSGNRAPQASDVSLTADPSMPYIEKQVIGIDPDHDTITYELVADETGTGYTFAYINPQSGVLYLILAPGFQGSIVLPYRVTDGKLFSTNAVVSIQVQAFTPANNTGNAEIDPKTYGSYRRGYYDGDLLGAPGAPPKLPSAVDLSKDFPRPGDQGQQSSCVD